MFYFFLFNVFTYKTESSHVGTRLPECREAERSWLYSSAPPSPLSPTPGRNFSSPGWLVGEICDCIQQVPSSESIYCKPNKFGLIQYICAAFICDILSLQALLISSSQKHFTKHQCIYPIKKRYREEHMKIAEWAKKETLRPGEAGGARPETWLYNF